MRNIVVGDVVKLKSGSPNMTVKEIIKIITTKQFIKCEWFDEKSVYHCKEFRSEQLEKVTQYK